MVGPPPVCYGGFDAWRAVRRPARRNALPVSVANPTGILPRSPLRAPPRTRTDMKLSARNQIKGTIVEVKTGATTAHVRLEIAPGRIITASITNEAVEELGLKKGHAATAVIKASDVMIATD
jgi:molybdopterin-binding protein